MKILKWKYFFLNTLQQNLNSLRPSRGEFKRTDADFLINASLTHGEGNGTPLQCSCLGNPMDRGAWKAAVHGVVNSWTRLSDVSFTFHFHALEKKMATHSGVLAWRIPGTGQPGGLLSMGLHRVRHDWSNLAAAAAAVCMLSHIWLFVTPWTTAQQPSLSMGFTRQEYWSL